MRALCREWCLSSAWTNAHVERKRRRRRQRRRRLDIHYYAVVAATSETSAAVAADSFAVFAYDDVRFERAHASFARKFVSVLDLALVRICVRVCVCLCVCVCGGICRAVCAVRLLYFSISRMLAGAHAERISGRLSA